MFIVYFFNALRQAKLDGVSPATIEGICNHFTFMRDLPVYKTLIDRCVASLPPELQEEIEPIYNALTLYAGYFSEPKYKEHVLQKYVVEGNVAGVAVGIELGVNVNTVIGYVPDLSHSQFVQGLLQLLSLELPRAWTSNTHRCTPLVLASCLGHYDLVKYLVSHGADLNAETRHHNNPLDLATQTHPNFI